MKNYSQEVITNVQQSIDDKQYTIDEIKSFEELPHVVKVNGATLSLSDVNGRKDTVLNLAYTYDDTDMKTYKHEAFGKFYSKDWKRGNKGEETYKNYKIFKASIKNVDIVALIRKTSDYEYQEGDELNYYADLVIDELPYVIIKAYCPTLHESFATESLFDEKNFSEKLILSYGIMQSDDDDSDNTPDDPQDSYESEELF